MESSAAEKSVCSRPYLRLLLFHKHKANILLRLFKMCMNNIAEKSSKLHRPEKCGRCRRCRCSTGSVCSRTVLSTFKRAAHTPKHKHVHGKLSHTSTETHTHTHSPPGWNHHVETMLRAAPGSLAEKVSVAFVCVLRLRLCHHSAHSLAMCSTLVNQRILSALDPRDLRELLR